MKKPSAKKAQGSRQKKAPKKATAAKKATTIKKAAVSTKASVVPAMGQPVEKQPSSKQQAAEVAGIFLHTDDSWAAVYFDPNDLRFLDRQLFG